ncbi:Polyribonucleotide nucleotidyltransferase [uncultured Ruminococcus sp.]|uniref:Polyribonucleotide nucleotidyltransferase n=1 Tax=Massiliimalia timonensis TaxID=1987501 RepID=A0A8J6TQV8_9FIRM|nr:polyribonucleotide nucleotidyltransferase [Massiliimalia timonensis]MBC8609791.1 polyribonucleotide nucleotidyltransferase [Massiliimalia timonensis]SCH25338.1 Polyribonucleotide nucleotidyltransferase [uncultured Ruminococcus sp.]SCH29951.1 Polyribonucleotide nucleotidyltransferase [uncultured Clostridium sp.]
MLNNPRTFTTTYAGRPLTVQTGKTCELSNGSCWVRYGDTVVMANVTASPKPREGVDFFPLSVDYEEKLYAVGKIPGSFLKREARPSENAILTSRMVDRPMRPLFPKDMRNDVSIVMTVLATDIDNSPEIAGSIAASIAVSISDVPFNGPIATISVGLVDGEIVLNPITAQREKSDLNLTVAGSRDKIVMIEAGANEVDNETMLKAIETGHEEIKKMVDFIASIQAEIGKEKFTFESQEVPHDMFDDVAAIAYEDTKLALDTDNKLVRDERLLPIYERVYTELEEKYPDSQVKLDECMYKLQKKIVREWLFEGKRVDGRQMDEIRPLASEVGVLPRVHGSGLFTRGQTQVLSVATLGPIRDIQNLDGIDENSTKRYMHHYNFPSYSVGETRPSRGPGRREIGHGALAEKALVPVLPSLEEFPYAIRVVSEVLSSNGSTSQGSICGSTLALMDAGVPLKAPVAGISCGLITKEDGSFTTMVDIQGLEDFYGDMDFKVGGTHKGITAIQVDIKVDGLTMDIIREAFEKTEKARNYILDEIMLKALPAPRETVGEFAPKVLQTKLPVDKIKDVIGKGGSVIQKICAECDVKIDIDDDGLCVIMGVNLDNARRALYMVETIAMDPEVGAIYKGVVTRLMNFGAFVEIAPGKEGLVHISKLENHRVEKVEDVVSVGDEIVVKVIEIDDQGRINLSRKDAIADIAAKQAEKENQ